VSRARRARAGRGRGALGRRALAAGCITRRILTSPLPSSRSAGADVVLADLPERAAETAAVARLVEGFGRRALAVEMDVRDRLSVDAAFEKVYE
jgi:hypothetical protein